MEKVELSVADYLSTLDDVARPTMTALDARVRAGLQTDDSAVWQGTFWGGTDQSIIGYLDIVQHRPKGNDVEWFAVGLARQKAHYSIYVNAAEDGRYLGRLYAERLGKVKVGAASLGFRRLEDVDLDVLDELLAHVARVTRS